ncbi:MAG: hypothetical protein JF616_05290 [Fibrobacteres bacterium]|nr:hypothetical protein [Fibrobacterota bacterium]
MSRGNPLLLLAWLPMMLAPGSNALAADGNGPELSSGVNLTADEGFGARQSGMAVTFPAFQRDADAVVNAPAAMNDVEDFTFSTAHAEKFGRAQFDDFAFILPFEANATLGLGLSRFGVSDIELRPEGTDPLASEPQGLFSVADYVVTGSFARRLGDLDIGFGLDLLYRHLDQDGVGLRADGMAQYTWDDRFRLAALVKGLVPSSAHWESGYTEYETPDLYIGGSGRFPAPYFYGTLEASIQSEGLFSDHGKSQLDLNGGNLRTDPAALLAATHVGLEFLFDFGMAVRMGLTELAPHSVATTATFGIGYTWKHILGIDYSFTPHPDLLSTHRISLQLTPAFPKLDGRGYRPRRATAVGADQPNGSTLPPEEGEIEEPSGGIPAPKNPAAPTAAPSAPAPAKESPTAAPVPAKASDKPAPPAKPVPAQNGEILDNNEN